MRISLWRQKVNRFRALEAVEQRLVLRSARYLCSARIMLLATPFPRLVRNLSQAGEVPRQAVDATFPVRLTVALAIASSHVPWRSDCFVQAIAARLMLRAAGFRSTIHLGVEQSGDDAIAGHAWLSCGGAIVVGGEGLDRYTEFLALTA